MIELITDRPTAKLRIDKSKKIAYGELKGDIPLEDYKEMLSAFGESIRSGFVDSIVMDRVDANKVDTQARVWLKNVGFKEYSKEVNKIRKFAIIKSKSTIGDLYSGAIYSTLKLFYPNLTVKSFDSQEKAINWVLDEKQEAISFPDSTNEKTNNSDTSKSMKDVFIDKLINFLTKFK